MKNDLADKIEPIFSDVQFNYGLLIRMNGQTLVEHRSRASFPSASLIKLAILADILDSHIQLDQMIPVHEDQLVGGAGVLQLLQPRDWKLRDLLALMISDSDNSATNVVISFIGMEHVQNYLKSNGFEQTKLNRYLMDGRSLALGIDNFTSAEESLRLLDSALSHGATIASWFKDQQFRYKLPGNFDESNEKVVVYNKTGEGYLIDHDVAKVVYNNKAVDVGLLTSGSNHRMDTLHIFNQVGQTLLDWLKME
ncbi:serine hydrolase [Lentilactobacillus kefiri]|uniref:serine hydrolase n=1 Tax=Lentilactobacillus kefiri TaxID=33962 RepID=UPI0021C3958F|nr:serine hydrolase [Lentilactobacillus kefiri]MCP9369924.1 serine hydrolase [Lentilactobacillus kefiri]